MLYFVVLLRHVSTFSLFPYNSKRMRDYLFISLLSAAFVSMNLSAQVSYGGEPLSAALTRSYSREAFEEMPSFDVAKELRDDLLGESDLRSGYRFAYKFMTHFDRYNSGSSFTLPDGTRVWRLGIRSKNALSINVLFTEYELPEGAQVFLYTPGRTQVLGAFNHLNNSELGLLPVSPLEGDEIIIEYQEPARAAFAGRLSVGEVNHGYRSLSGYEPGGDRSELSCMPSPVCFEDEKGFDPISRSVVLITIDGIRACTGVLVNNTLNDGKPYLLTASHCLNKDFSILHPDYDAVAGTIISFFNYNSPTCNIARRGTEEMSVASAKYRAVNVKSDMALLELLETPPAYYRPYYAGWSIEENGGTPPYAGVHHPQASVKRISVSEGNLTLKTFMSFYKSAHWNVAKWNAGCTAEGSSGSPLFDSANRIVGLLSGGISTCSAPADDYYYAVFKAWSPEENVNEQLKHWLDPSGSGVLTLDGLDPYAETPYFRLSNVLSGRQQDSMEVSVLPSPASGRLFGVNSLHTTEYAEEYQAGGRAQIDGLYLVTPSITDPAGSLKVEVSVYSGEGKPGEQIHAETFSPAYTELSFIDSSFIETGKRLNREQESFVRFSRAVIVSGTFYVGYKILAPDSSSFAVYNLPKGMATMNTAWIHQGGDWIRSSAHPTLPFSTSLFIDPVIHYTNDVSNDSLAQDEQAVRIFQDVDRNLLHVIFAQAVDKADFKLYATSGVLQVQQSLSGSEAVIPVSGLHTGVYIISVRAENFSHTQKVVL